RAVTCLHTELSPFVCDESPSEGLYADCPSGSRRQKVERVAHPEGFAFEIGRIASSCLEEGAVNLLFRPFIQSTVHLRFGGGVESKRGVDGCLRAFSARSRNTILTF